MPKSMGKVLIICGPTASGKTDFAHHIALNNNGEIVNADSMQLYRQLPIITASPDSKLRQELPYHLYNFQNIDRELSAAKYAQIAKNTISDISSRGNLPIIVGGSGMYISMLVNGYNDIPDIDDNVRQKTRDLHKKLGVEKFFEELKKIDSEITKILNMHDTQRIIRAYEVFQQSGKSILSFHDHENIKPLEDFDIQIIFLLPERNFLYKNCNERLVKLFQNGAIEEVENLYKNYGEIQTSAARALGVSEIISHLKGEISLDKAIDFASARTRQYAKRQITWFKNQIKEKQTIAFGSTKEYQSTLLRIKY